MDEKMKTFNQLFINEEIIINDVYGLRDEILDEFKKKFDYEKYKKLIDNEINSLIDIIQRHYDNKPSKEQLKIEIERSMNNIKLKENIINEGFEDELRGKLSDKYLSLKRGILDLLDKALNSDATKLQDFVNKFIDPESEEILDGFVEDADIFDFYLKYQSDIDQILLDHNYYDDLPEVESLYDYVIDGTFDAVVYCMEEMKKELYGE
jgi:hypothetical protein